MSTNPSADGLTPEQRGLAVVGQWLAMTVDHALSPALEGGRVKACEHAKLGAETLPMDGEPREFDRGVYMCPMHPERLLCSEGTCLADHVKAQHQPDEIRCFVCEVDCCANFFPVDAKITTHRNFNIEFQEGPPGDKFLTALSYAFGGTIWTLPAAYLCTEHAPLLPEPIRMAWPMGMGDVGPEDAVA
jgi:hypothetical protein